MHAIAKWDELLLAGRRLGVRGVHAPGPQAPDREGEGMPGRRLGRVGREGRIKFWGNSFVAGPFGEIVAHAQPDGYTLLLNGSTLWLMPYLRAHVPYDPVRDFAPISLAIKSPNILVVHPSVPAKSVTELIDLARAKPGVLNFVSSGVGSNFHLAGELFKLRAGLDLVHVPYKGGGPAIVDLVSGQVPMMFDTSVVAGPHIESGKLRALAVTSAKRAASMPTVPTMAESGVPGYDVVSWQAVFAPAGTPKEVVKYIDGNVKDEQGVVNPVLEDLACGTAADRDQLPQRGERQVLLMAADQEEGPMPLDVPQEPPHAEVPVRDPQLAGTDVHPVQQRTLLGIGILAQDHVLDDPVISDVEYDRLLNELKKIEADIPRIVEDRPVIRVTRRDDQIARTRKPEITKGIPIQQIEREGKKASRPNRAGPEIRVPAGGEDI